MLDTYADSVLADSPVSYHRVGSGEMGLVDLSGNGNDAYTAGNVTPGIEGAITDDPDTAYQITATGSIRYPHTPQLLLRSGWCVEGWVKPAPILSGGIGGLFQKTLRGGPNPGIEIFFNDTYQLWTFYAADWYSFTGPGYGPAMVPNQWNYFAVEYDLAGDGTNAVLTQFVNGAYARLSVGRVTDFGTHPVSWGDDSYPWMTWYTYTGGLDELAIYDHPIGVDRMTAHWERGIAGMRPDGVDGIVPLNTWWARNINRTARRK